MVGLDAGHGGEPGPLSPARPAKAADRLVDVGLEAGELLPAARRADGRCFSAGADQALLALALGEDDHLDDLASPSDKIGQKPGLFVGHRPGCPVWPPRRNGRDHRRVDRVGLGSFAERLGEGAHLRRIDHDDRQACRRKARQRDDRLIAAGRLDRDRLGPRAGASRAISRLSTLCVPFDGERLPRSDAPPRPARSFDTSMPDNDGVHPVPSLRKRGLRWRPKRLFGFDGTTGEDPNSPTGLASLGGIGLSPATAQAILPGVPATTELQGGERERSPRKLKSRRR